MESYASVIRTGHGITTGKMEMNLNGGSTIGGANMENGYIKLLEEAFGPEDFMQIEMSEFLDNREKLIILGYYRDKKILQKIGDELGITRERVRQIKLRAMDGVRATLYQEHLSQLKREEYQTPVEKFEELSVRSRNALMRNKLTTAMEIARYIQGKKDMLPDEALMQIRGIGRKSAKEICSFLKRDLRIPIKANGKIIRIEDALMTVDTRKNYLLEECK